MAEDVARSYLGRLWQAWFSIKGLPKSPDERLEWARLAVYGEMVCQRCSKKSPALMLIPVLQPPLPHSKQMRMDQLQTKRHGNSIIYRASAAAPGRLRRHG